MYECKVCGKKFKKIVASHLKSHGMTTTDYREKFGEEGLILNHCLFVKSIRDNTDEYQIEKMMERVIEKRKKGHKVGEHHHWQ